MVISKISKKCPPADLYNLGISILWWQNWTIDIQQRIGVANNFSMGLRLIRKGFCQVRMVSGGPMTKWLATPIQRRRLTNGSIPQRKWNKTEKNPQENLHINFFITFEKEDKNNAFAFVHMNLFPQFEKENKNKKAIWEIFSFSKVTEQNSTLDFQKFEQYPN